MDILVIGGTGNISWRLSRAAIDAGWHVTLLNRGGPDRVRRPPLGCDVIFSDIRDANATEAALGARSFDVAVDFVCYNEQQARRAVAYFGKRVRHYLFISTTAVYDREIARTPLVEESPVVRQGWDYALAKVAAERAFAGARSHEGFPVTVLRPAHTYDTIVPEAVGDGDWTNPWRLLNGKPVVLHGDGTTLWTVTHSSDFAGAVIAFLKSGHPPGETFHITSDDVYTWRQITAAVGRELGVSAPKICYRTTEEIDGVAPRYGNGIKWHKMWCDIYDNKKFKAACPSWHAGVSLENGIKETIAYFRQNARLMRPDGRLDATLDRICAMRSEP